MSTTLARRAVKAAVAQLPPIARGVSPQFTVRHAVHLAAETVRGLIITYGPPNAREWAEAIPVRNTAPAFTYRESREQAMLIEACEPAPDARGLAPIFLAHLTKSEGEKLEGGPRLIEAATTRVGREAVEAEAVRAAWRTCVGPIAAALIAEHGGLTTSNRYGPVKRLWHSFIFTAVEAGAAKNHISRAMGVTERTIYETLKRGRDL